MAQRADGVIEKHKAFAYITWQGRLLVFRQPDFPEAGVQVPAGTIEVDEMPEAAVLREAYEETGLAHLTVVRFLGANSCAALFPSECPFGRRARHLTRSCANVAASRNAIE